MALVSKPDENEIIALLLVTVNFERKTPCSSVSTVEFEHVFFFWV